MALQTFTNNFSSQSSVTRDLQICWCLQADHVSCVLVASVSEMWPAQWPLNTKMLDESASSWLPIWLRGNDWLPVVPVNRVHVWLPKARIQLLVACQLVAGSMTCSSQLHYEASDSNSWQASSARLQLCRCTDRIPNCLNMWLLQSSLLLTLGSRALCEHFTIFYLHRRVFA